MPVSHVTALGSGAGLIPFRIRFPHSARHAGERPLALLFERRRMHHVIHQARKYIVGVQSHRFGRPFSRSSSLVLHSSRDHGAEIMGRRKN